MYLAYYGRNLLLIVAKVKETLCPQHVTGSATMFTMSISGDRETSLSSGKLGPATVTVRVNKPEVWLQTGGALTGIFFLKFFRINVRNLFVLEV